MSDETIERAAGRAPRELPQPGATPAPGLPRVVPSRTLFDGASRLAILHNDALYFLTETRSGKLILTK
jgi:hemin uptake protein HemP